MIRHWNVLFFLSSKGSGQLSRVASTSPLGGRDGAEMPSSESSLHILEFMLIACGHKSSRSTASIFLSVLLASDRSVRVYGTYIFRYHVNRNTSQEIERLFYKGFFIERLFY
jgi:hypothetical protein